jgi:hypothetical protein
MKIKAGHGGVNAKGEFFHTEEEREVPDDYFQQLAKAMFERKPPDTIIMSEYARRAFTKRKL